jgi:hypothetical protein
VKGAAGPPKEREKWIEIGEKCGQRVLYLLLYIYQKREYTNESHRRALSSKTRARVKLNAKVVERE